MTSAKSATIESRTRPRWRRRFIVLAMIALTVAAVFFWASFLRHPVAGEIHLGTAHGEDQLELYVGSRFVGHNKAQVPWSDIFGWSSHQSLGIVLPADTADVDRDAADGTLGDITAERLAGKGATIIHYSNGSPMWFSNVGRQEFSKKEILLRRPDGSLDHVFCLDGRLNDLFGNPHRVIVPIRVRSASGTPTAYFTTEHRNTPTGRFSNVLNRACPIWNFEHGESPAEFAQEIKEKGLWRPSK